MIVADAPGLAAGAAIDVQVGVLTADDVTRFLTEEMAALARVMPVQIQREEARLA